MAILALDIFREDIGACKTLLAQVRVQLQIRINLVEEGAQFSRATFQTHSKTVVRDVFANAGSATLLILLIVFEACPAMPSAEVEIRIVVELNIDDIFLGQRSSELWEMRECEKEAR